MFYKTLAVFVFSCYVCVTAEESNECIDTSSSEADSEEDVSPEVLNRTDVASYNNESSLVDEMQQKIVDAVNLTLSAIEAAVDEAEEKWNAWVKNYNCTNSATSLVRCVTSVRTLKGPHSWRANTSQVGFPTELPSDVTPDVSDANWPQKIANGLEDWLSNVNRLISKTKQIIKKSTQAEKGN